MFNGMKETIDIKSLKSKVIHELNDIKSVMFKDIKLKSGLVSPFYVDLRRTMRYPKLVKDICSLMLHNLSNFNFDIVCGVPYAALHLSSMIANILNVPTLLVRDKSKSHGCMNLIEGIYYPEENVLLCEDVMVSGQSIASTVSICRKNGLNVDTVLVAVDREQGGQENLAKIGLNVISALTISEIIDELMASNKMSKEYNEHIHQWIKENQTTVTEC